MIPLTWKKIVYSINLLCEAEETRDTKDVRQRTE